MYRGVVLICHNIHLIKMDLWHVVVRTRVYVFLRDEGKGDGRLFVGCSSGYDGGDVGENVNWCAINCNDDTIM